jgi:Flp pilus assembly protein TadG
MNIRAAMRGLGIVRREEGAALVEFAVVLPLLVLLLLGMMEFGLLLYNQHVITNASREGARYGIVAHSPRRTAGEIDQVVLDYCEDNLVTFGGGTPSTAIDPTNTSGALFGTDLTVTVTFHYDFLVLPNFMAFLVGGSDLQAETTMKYE